MTEAQDQCEITEAPFGLVKANQPTHSYDERDVEMEL
jgi:hypothetical protein